jgi:hypothetical protein
VCQTTSSSSNNSSVHSTRENKLRRRICTRRSPERSCGSASAIYSSHARKDPPNILDILPSGLTDTLSGVVDKLPVGVLVPAPVLPEKRKAAIEVSLGGAGVSLRDVTTAERAAMIAVDLESTGINI